MQNEIKGLIAQNKIAEAINLLMSSNVDGALSLLGRLSKLRRQISSNSISLLDAKAELAKIGKKAIELSSVVKKPEQATEELTLLKNKKQRKTKSVPFSIQSAQIFERYTKWNEEKRESAAYDFENKELKSIISSLKELLKKIEKTPLNNI